VIVAPTGNFAEQVPFGQLIAPLSLITVPLLLRPIDSVTSDVFVVVLPAVVDVVVVGVVLEVEKVAPTFKCASTRTVQLFDVPEHAPVQPVNLTPPPLDAINVVVAPAG